MDRLRALARPDLDGLREAELKARALWTEHRLAESSITRGCSASSPQPRDLAMSADVRSVRKPVNGLLGSGLASTGRDSQGSSSRAISSISDSGTARSRMT
jgi:hypothetical protein